MCDALERIFDGMREGIQGVDAPLVTRAMVCRVANTVEHRVTQVDIG